ncbi:hypothetical protein B1B04_23425 [Lysinibacillus sp. KCTC 33748]|nr:hypothetical protein B1B04_23425 [Lysinibacillus sp. KCTC 33748]SKC16459.1 hypothetical protein SAMN06295926_1327 [Lysinibacillus sp. AC-3]
MGILPNRHYSRICSFQTFKRATTPNYFLVNILYVKTSYTSRKKRILSEGILFFAKKVTYAMGFDCGVRDCVGYLSKREAFCNPQNERGKFIVH